MTEIPIVPDLTIVVWHWSWIRSTFFQTQSESYGITKCIDKIDLLLYVCHTDQVCEAMSRKSQSKQS